MVKESYSFSRLTSFHTCPYAWYRRYVLGEHGEGNAFSDYGTLVHSIMERWAKGELALPDLAPTFQWEFDDALEHEFPPNTRADLRSLYYKQGCEFLADFAGFENCEVLSAEEKFDTPIGDWVFNGIIDLTLRDKTTGAIKIRDYKSKKEFKSPEEQKKYGRQLMLYARHVHDQYGVWPEDVGFIHFRAKGARVNTIIRFTEQAAAEAAMWADNTVEEIRTVESFEPKTDDFFCNHLCNYRSSCRYKTEVHTA